MLILVILIALLWLNPFAQKQSVDPTGWVQLIPSENIDKRVKCLRGNNNLDAVQYKERYYVAFRTAPTHFASRKTKLYIISSNDLENWDYEHEIHMGSDMREPRFVVYKDTLFFYFFQGGKVPYKFEPKHVWVSYLDAGVWQSNQNLDMDGYIPWRLRNRADTLYLSAYFGKDIYNSKHQGSQRLFISTNGFDFEPISEEVQAPGLGVEEGAFIFDTLGNLWSTLRMEGDGSYLAYADKNDLANWQTKYSKNKYDSALLFEYKGEIYLVSRRNMDGFAKKSNSRLYNLVRYSFTKKKTALFRIDQQKMEIKWIKDFPSTGDTAFPGIIDLGNGKFFLLNYSSNIHKKEKNWIKGQLGKTYIYSTILDMDEVLKE